jgi:hypothetical protein
MAFLEIHSKLSAANAGYATELEPTQQRAKQLDTAAAQTLTDAKHTL